LNEGEVALRAQSDTRPSLPHRDRPSFSFPKRSYETFFVPSPSSPAGEVDPQLTPTHGNLFSDREGTKRTQPPLPSDSLLRCGQRLAYDPHYFHGQAQKVSACFRADSCLRGFCDRCYLSGCPVFGFPFSSCVLKCPCSCNRDDFFSFFFMGTVPPAACFLHRPPTPDIKTQFALLFSPISQAPRCQWAVIWYLVLLSFHCFGSFSIFEDFPPLPPYGFLLCHPKACPGKSSLGLVPPLRSFVISLTGCTSHMRRKSPAISSCFLRALLGGSPPKGSWC